MILNTDDGIEWDDEAEAPKSLTTLPTYADAITVLSAHAMRLRDAVAR